MDEEYRGVARTRSNVGQECASPVRICTAFDGGMLPPSWSADDPAFIILHDRNIDVILFPRIPKCNTVAEPSLARLLVTENIFQKIIY